MWLLHVKGSSIFSAFALCGWDLILGAGRRHTRSQWRIQHYEARNCTTWSSLIATDLSMVVEPHPLASCMANLNIFMLRRF